MPRYWQDRVWSTMLEFKAEAGLRRSRTAQDSTRTMVLLAAYLGSPGTCTARAMGMTHPELSRVVKGRLAPTLIELDRLHDWVAASLWRHLWRAGSPDHASPEAIEDALTHAARLADVPADWTRDWALAASGFKP